LPLKAANSWGDRLRVGGANSCASGVEGLAVEIDEVGERIGGEEGNENELRGVLDLIEIVLGRFGPGLAGDQFDFDDVGTLLVPVAASHT
jgi:hypothetical protein